MQYQFKEETQGLNAALIYSLTPSDELDEMSLEMLVRNAIPGLVPVSSSSLDGTLSLRYNVTGMKKLSRVFSGTVSRQQLLGCLLDICDTFATAANYMLEESTLLLHPNEIYLQAQTGRVKMICLPLLNVQGQLPLHEFLKQIMFTTRFDPHEDCSHVAQIINYLNSTDSFTAQELRTLVQSLLVSAPVQPQRPAPAPTAAPISTPVAAPVAPAARPAQPAAPRQTVQTPPARPIVPSQPQAAVEPAPAVNAPSFPTPTAAPQEAPKVSSAAPAFAVPGMPGGFAPAVPQKPLTPKEQKKREKQQQKEEKAANKEKGHFSLFGKGKKKEPAQPAAEAAANLPGTPAGMAIPGAGKPLYKPASPSRAKVAAEQPFSYAAPASQAAQAAQAAPLQATAPAQVQIPPVSRPQQPIVPAASRPVMPPVGGMGFCTVTIADPNALPLIEVQDFSDGTMFPDDDNTMLQNENDSTELAGTTPQAKAAWIRCRATGEASRINKCLFVLGRYGEPKHRPDGSVDYPADCTVRTQDRGISRRHAAILFYGGRFYLADISSRHETYLNGILTEHEDNAQMQAVPITFTRAYPLKNGDIIRLRSEEFQFEEG